MAWKQQSKTSMSFSFDGLTSHSTGSRTSNGSAATSGQNASLGYRFPLVVLKDATNNFDKNWLIGVGSFGKVYKGVLRDKTKVAVKRGNPENQEGVQEFFREVVLLSGLRHHHLVSLVGYCDEQNKMILVYEYMEKGTLTSHLYGSNLPSLCWKQRLEICIGSARGLHYIHTGFAKAIIHRDVKSSNILLDGNLMAKISDFGISRPGPDLDETHVSTSVKGTFGYVDPEYFRTARLTEKSDVYAFGVVLLEVLCARPAIDPTLRRESASLAEWAMEWQKRGELAQIVDPRIAGTIRPDSLRKFVETVEKCLADFGVERPAMGDVLSNLEYVLQLQEADLGTSEFNSIIRIAELPSQVQNIMNHDGAAVGGVGTSSSNDLYDVTMSIFFSQPFKADWSLVHYYLQAETYKKLFSSYEMACLWKQQSKTSMSFSFNGLTSHSTGSRTNGNAATSGQNASIGYRFPLVVLQDATNNFDKNWLIGVGGFGKVYKGVLRDGTKVAVKWTEPTSREGVDQCFTEIRLLSRLRHDHLVSFVGYCDEWNRMCLVSEYMEKGTLTSHLYGSNLPSLSWKQRLEICIGSARGLQYLHTGFAQAIIHRDVKSSNILLDGNLVAKIADFGLSRTRPDLDETHVNTRLAGTIGYMDPDYFFRDQLTEKLDVYSFGVVLLEVLCAKPAIITLRRTELKGLAAWAMEWLKKGELEQIVDPRIAGTIRPDSLRKFVQTVEKCLADFGVERPAMGDVLLNLEYVLQLQEADLGTS